MSEEADIQRRIDEYLAWMEVVSLSDRTIQVRRKYLKYFREWCENRGINTIEEISRPVVERFQKSLFHYKKKDGKPLAVCSQYSRLSALKAFFKYLAQQRIIMYNPTGPIKVTLMLSFDVRCSALSPANTTNEIRAGHLGLSATVTVSMSIATMRGPLDFLRVNVPIGNCFFAFELWRT